MRYLDHIRAAVDNDVRLAFQKVEFSQVATALGQDLRKHRTQSWIVNTSKQLVVARYSLTLGLCRHFPIRAHTRSPGLNQLAEAKPSAIADC
ncbi:hypothetical protein D3C76_1722760 [compost metagenome]